MKSNLTVSRQSFPQLSRRKFFILLSLVSLPVAGGFTQFSSTDNNRFIRKIVVAVNPEVELQRFVTEEHSRILTSFGSERYAFSYVSDVTPAQSFVQSNAALSSYKKTVNEWFAPASEALIREPVATQPMFKFESVGFPHIETSKRRAAKRYKAYHPLLKIKKTANGSTRIVPNVACYGYSPERTAKRAAQYESKIIRYSNRYKISPNLVKAVIAQESCFRKNLTSPVGAHGLMQLMPETATWLGVTNSANVDQNLRGGIKYLAQLKRRFGSTELALAAYNAGPGNVERYKGIPPFAETQKYVVKVLGHYQSYVAMGQYASLSNPS